MILSTIGGFVMVITGLELAMLDEGWGFAALINTPAAKLILICGLGAAMISAPGSRALLLPLTLLKALLPTRYRPTKAAALVESCVSLADQVQRSGPAALTAVPAKADPFLKRGVALMADGIDGKSVAGILHAEIAAMEDRHADTYRLVAGLARVAEGAGTIGSLIGVIVTLGNLEDTSKLGPSIATALLAALYGAILSSLILTPLSTKLERRSQQEVAMKRMLVEGLSAIERGESPSLVRERMTAGFSERQRARIIRRLASTQGG